jgi:soluble lytic murein transglycosylase-like protein
MRILSLAALLTVCSSCAPSLPEQVHRAQSHSCPAVLDLHARLSKDPAAFHGYPGAQVRLETDAAFYWLERRQPEKALAMVETWNDGPAARQVRARANAMLAREEPTRDAIARVARQPLIPPDFSRSDSLARYSFPLGSRTSGGS